MATGAATSITFNQTIVDQAHAHVITNYSGANDTLIMGSTTTVHTGDTGTSLTYLNGFATAPNLGAFLADIQLDTVGIAGHVAAWNDGANTWVASVNNVGVLTNLVELVGVTSLTAVAGAGAANVFVG
jgi:hypothetical protein